jgi:hypothetical protein
VIDPIVRTAADPHHPPVLDGDVQSAAIAAEQACGRYPSINLVGLQPISQVHVYAYGPGLAWRIWGSLTPNVVAGACCCHACAVPAERADHTVTNGRPLVKNRTGARLCGSFAAVDDQVIIHSHHQTCNCISIMFSRTCNRPVGSDGRSTHRVPTRLASYRLPIGYSTRIPRSAAPGPSPMPDRRSMADRVRRRSCRSAKPHGVRARHAGRSRALRSCP